MNPVHTIPSYFSKIHLAQIKMTWFFALTTFIALRTFELSIEIMLPLIFDEQLHNLYSSLNITRMISSSRWAEHVARMGRIGMRLRFWWEY
jgi:hypothetical protein